MDISKKDKIKITIEVLEKLYESYDAPYYCEIHNKEDKCISCPEQQECFDRFDISDDVEYRYVLNSIKLLLKKEDSINKIL